MIVLLMVLITVIGVAVFSGYNQYIKNISVLLTSIILITGILSMYVEKKIVPKYNLKHIGRIGWAVAIVFYAAYGLWYQCGAMLISVVCLTSMGVLYKPKNEK